MELHELDKQIEDLRRLNNRSRELLFYGSKTRHQRMELNAWIARNEHRIKQLEKQRNRPETYAG